MRESCTPSSMSGKERRSDGLLGERGNERRRAPQAPPVLHATALLLDSTPHVAPTSTATKNKVRELLTANPHDLHTDQFAQRPQSSALSRLGEIRVPTLIIVGEHDIPDVHAHAGAIEAGIARSRREVVSNAGHLVHMEQPERFNTSARGFLDRLH